MGISDAILIHVLRNQLSFLLIYIHLPLSRQFVLSQGKGSFLVSVAINDFADV